MCACYHCATSRTVLFRFVPPAPIKTKTGKATTLVCEWDGERLVAFLQESLEIWAVDKHPDFEVRAAVSRQAEIRSENWKPEKRQAEELRAEIGQVMEGIEPEDDLSE